jgi:hypothetical protein
MIQSLPSGSRQYVSNHLTTDSEGIRTLDPNLGKVLLGLPGTIRHYPALR